MTPSRLGPGLVGGAYLAAAAALFFVASGRPGPIRTQDAFDETQYHEAGKALWNGVDIPGPGGAAYHMPMAGLTAAFLDRASSEGRAAGHRFLGQATLLLILCLGCALGSPMTGLPAAVLWHFGPMNGQIAYPESLQCVLLLLAACAAAHDARERSAKSAAFLGAAIGANFLVRSTLVLLPVLLASREAWREPRLSVLRRPRLWLVGVLPYAFLLPWVAMNAVVYDRFTPFEAGQAGVNIVTGALGIVSTVEGDPSALAADLPDKTRLLEVLGWALKEIARHPSLYLRSTLERVAYVVGQQPLLWTGSLMSLLLLRRRVEVLSAGLLAVYYLAIHCLMSVEPRYFHPVMPLLSMLTAAPLMAIDPAGLPAASWVRRAGSALWRLMLAGALGMTAVTFYAVCGYAAKALRRPPGSMQAFDEAVARTVDDPWLLRERGSRRLIAGDLPGAAADLAVAARLDPADPVARRQAAGGRFLLGGGDSGLLDPGISAGLRGKSIQAAFLLQAEAHLAARRPAKARELIDAAMAAWRSNSVRVRRMETERDLEAWRRLSAPAVGYTHVFGLLLEYRPKGRSLAIYRELFRAAGRDLPPADPAWHPIALILQDAGAYEDALDALDGLVARKPSSARLLSDRGVCRYLAGDAKTALRDLEAAVGLDPAWLPPYLSLAHIRLERKEERKALEVYKRALQRGAGPLKSVLETDYRRLRDKLSRSGD